MTKFVDEYEGQPSDPYQQMGISGDTRQIWRDIIRKDPASVKVQTTTLDNEDYMNTDHSFSVYPFVGIEEEDTTPIKRKHVSKKLRVKLVRERGGLCEVCNSDMFDDVDHRDGNHSNNNEDNLQLICVKCHRRKHKKELVI